jgi:hypothetical protein
MHANPSKDIWSLGCVFSEAVYWSVFGPSGHRHYQDMRRSSTVPILKDSAYSGCFHNGHSIHDIVRLFHRDAIKNRRTNIDDIVNHIVYFIEEMLGDQHARPNALELHRRLTVALDLVRAPVSNSSLARYPANGAGTRLPPPISPDENALHLHFSPLFPSSPNITSDPHRGVSMITSAQAQPSHSSNPDHTWPNNSVASSRNRPVNEVNVAQDRLSRGRSFRYDHSPTTDLFDDKAFETTSGQASAFTQMPRDTHRPPSTSGYHGRQLSLPEHQTSLPTATVADVLEWINKKNLNSKLTFKDQGWLNVLHGRDHVSQSIHVK